MGNAEYRCTRLQVCNPGLVTKMVSGDHEITSSSSGSLNSGPVFFADAMLSTLLTFEPDFITKALCCETKY